MGGLSMDVGYDVSHGSRAALFRAAAMCPSRRDLDNSFTWTRWGSPRRTPRARPCASPIWPTGTAGRTNPRRSVGAVPTANFLPVGRGAWWEAPPALSSARPTGPGMPRRQSRRLFTTARPSWRPARTSLMCGVSSPSSPSNSPRQEVHN